jgi:hypothetical protein
MATFGTSPSVKSFLSAILVTALLLGGLPSLVGVEVVASDSKPAFSLDICHAVQYADSLVNIGITVPARPFSMRPVLPNFGAEAETVIPVLQKLNDPPPSPPPK